MPMKVLRQFQGGKEEENDGFQKPQFENLFCRVFGWPFRAAYASEAADGQVRQLPDD